jgi:hypothetical protein
MTRLWKVYPSLILRKLRIGCGHVIAEEKELIRIVKKP